MRATKLEVYRVGGSVRDELIGRRVKDADYVVRGVSMADLGERLRKTAFESGTINAYNVTRLKLRDGRQAGWRVNSVGLGAIEITLPRKELSTGPGHRDFEIVMDSELSLAEDSERRDFTFNALYLPMQTPYDVTNVIDPTGRGLYDLSRKLVNTTHPDSFRDDPLRMLRALRFVSQLGYDLSSNCEDEMKTHSRHITGLTASGHMSGTVYDEMSKLLMGTDAAKALRLARDTGVLGTLFPELYPMLGFDQGSRYHDMTTDEHVFKAIDVATKVDATLRVRWALLFHDSGKPETAWIGNDGRKHYYASKIANPFYDANDDLPEFIETEDHEIAGERRWRAAAIQMNVPKQMREDVSKLILAHMVTIKPKNVQTTVNRMRVRFGHELTGDLLMHRLCDLSGKGAHETARIEAIVAQVKALNNAVMENVPVSVKDLAINGRDLMEAGMMPSPDISKILHAVLDEVVCQPDELRRSRAWQLSAAERLM